MFRNHSCLMVVMFIVIGFYEEKTFEVRNGRVHDVSVMCWVSRSLPLCVTLVERMNQGRTASVPIVVPLFVVGVAQANDEIRAPKEQNPRSTKHCFIGLAPENPNLEMTSTWPVRMTLRPQRFHQRMS
jgi:hypothetical protein